MSLSILHVIPSVARSDGGPSRAVMDMCRALNAAGVGASLATTDADGPSRLPVELGAWSLREGVSTIFFPREYTDSFKVSRPFAEWLAANVEKFDCVHVHGIFSHACLAAARSCARLRVPYVVRPLGALERWSLRQKPVRKRLALALGGRALLRRAAAVHYTTARERRESESALRLSNGIVIPLGVELPRDPHPRPSATPSRVHWPVQRLPQVVERGTRGEDAVTILFLSRLHPKKGVELLLEAFAGIVLDEARSSGASSPRRSGATPLHKLWRGDGGEDRTRLVIAGSGDPAYEKELHALAEALGIAERVSFPGWLDGEAKSAAFAEADLFVLPSAQENFGLAVLEAMAAGVPVVVSRGVDLADEIQAENAGWVFDRSAASLARVLREALPDEPERFSRGARGRELASSRFNWAGIARELEGLYRAVSHPGRLSSPPGPLSTSCGSRWTDQ